MTVELVRYEAARYALQEAKTIDEVKEIRDRAVALAAYARQALDPDMINWATEIRVRAERKAGQMLHDMKASGQRDPGGRGRIGSRHEIQLKDLKITPQQSYKWQRLSDLDEEDFDRRVEDAKRTEMWIFDAFPGDRQKAKADRRAQHEKDLGDRIRALPLKQFGVILADPEWRFVPWNEETGSDRSAANHYATSALEDIKKRDVPSIAADDCVLALWATVPMLPQALEVMQAWGFEYRSHCVWLKPRAGTGYWFRNVHELLLIGVKGDVPCAAPGTQWDSAWDADPGEHAEYSAKPEEAYKLIETYFPNLPKIELNARIKRPGWEVWGAEAPVDLSEEG